MDKALYTELAAIIAAKLPEIRWVDLWHEQVSFLTTELPFPTPAVFIDWRTLSCDDLSMKAQELNLQVDFYLFYETFSDTYQGSANADTALAFLESKTNLHKAFHATHGETYSEMRRVYAGGESAGGAGNLSRVSFQCLAVDESAMDEVNSVIVQEIAVTRGTRPGTPTTEPEPLYVLP